MNFILNEIEQTDKIFYNKYLSDIKYIINNFVKYNISLTTKNINEIKKYALIYNQLKNKYYLTDNTQIINIINILICINTITTLTLDEFIKNYQIQILNNKIISINNNQYIKQIKPITLTYINNMNKLYGGLNKEITYIITGNTGLNHKYLEDIFKSYKWKKETLNTKYCVFIWAEMSESFNFDKKIYNIQCYLKNMLNDKKTIATNKWLLYTKLKEYYPKIAKKYMAETYKINEIQNIQNKPYILKPVGIQACGGKGIVRINNNNQFQEIKKCINNNTSNCLHYDLLKNNKNYIISEYITNVHLWNDRKYHLRMYWLVRPSYNNKPFYQTLFNIGKILIAKLPYKNEDFSNKLIHDTHADTTPRNLFFPNDINLNQEQINKIFNKMKKVLSYVGNMLEKNNVKPYPESKYAFEVFGCDFLIKNDLNIILMEINDKVGMWPVETDKNIEYYDKFTKKYYEWVFNEGIYPILSEYNN